MKKIDKQSQKKPPSIKPPISKKEELELREAAVLEKEIALAAKEADLILREAVVVAKEIALEIKEADLVAKEVALAIKEADLAAREAVLENALKSKDGYYVADSKNILLNPQK